MWYKNVFTVTRDDLKLNNDEIDNIWFQIQSEKLKLNYIAILYRYPINNSRK
jgi:hypothetical protein